MSSPVDFYKAQVRILWEWQGGPWALVDSTVAGIVAEGGTAAGIVADMVEPGAAEALVEAATSHFGKVDILVCNSGGQRKRAGFDDLTDQDFIDAYTDNVLSVVRLVRAALPGMRERRWGRVITIVRGGDRVMRRAIDDGLVPVRVDRRPRRIR